MSRLFRSQRIYEASTSFDGLYDPTRIKAIDDAFNSVSADDRHAEIAQVLEDEGGRWVPQDSPSHGNMPIKGVVRPRVSNLLPMATSEGVVRPRMHVLPWMRRV